MSTRKPTLFVHASDPQVVDFEKVGEWIIDVFEYCEFRQEKGECYGSFKAEKACELYRALMESVNTLVGDPHISVIDPLALRAKSSPNAPWEYFLCTPFYDWLRQPESAQVRFDEWLSQEKNR